MIPQCAPMRDTMPDAGSHSRLSLTLSFGNSWSRSSALISYHAGHFSALRCHSSAARASWSRASRHRFCKRSLCFMASHTFITDPTVGGPLRKSRNACSSFVFFICFIGGIKPHLPKGVNHLNAKTLSVQVLNGKTLFSVASRSCGCIVTSKVEPT